MKQQITIEVQTEHCQQWFDQKMAAGEWGGDAVYLGMEADPAVSSKIDFLKRPRGEHILTKLTRGDILVVAKFSRAFRSAADAERSIDTLNAMGINLVLMDLQIDTSTPVGRYMVSMMAAFARFERELILERTNEAISKRIKEGVWQGPPPPGYKHMRHPETGLKIITADHNEREIGRYCARMLYKGFDALTIASRLNHSLRDGLVQRQGQHRGSVFITDKTLVRWASYYVCDWPPITRKGLLALVGESCFTVEFVRQRYVEEFDLMKSDDLKLARSAFRKELQPFVA